MMSRRGGLWLRREAESSCSVRATADCLSLGVSSPRLRRERTRLIAAFVRTITNLQHLFADASVLRGFSLDARGRRFHRRLPEVDGGHVGRTPNAAFRTPLDRIALILKRQTRLG